MNGPTNGINPVKQLDLLAYVHESEKEFYEKIGQNTFNLESPSWPANGEDKTCLQLVEDYHDRKLPFTLAVTLIGDRSDLITYDAIALRNNEEETRKLAHKIYWFSFLSKRKEQFTYLGCLDDLQNTTSRVAQFIETYFKACDGDPEAQVTLGKAFEDGTALQNGEETKDLETAFRYYCASYRNNDYPPKAAFHVGRFCEKGLGGNDIDMSKALNHYNNALSGFMNISETHRRISVCKRKIGIIQLNSNDSTKTEEAIQHLTAAADASDIKAQITLAKHYREKHNHKTAMRWYDEASQRKKEYTYEYATYLLERKEEKHTLKAIDLLLELIIDEDIGAIQKMAELLKNGHDNIEPNIGQAMHLYQLLETHVPGRVAHIIGKIYHDGVDTRMDPIEAFKWFEQSDEPRAKHTMGLWLIDGIIIPRNEKRGFECLQEAAKKINKAKYHLALCHYYGIGTAQNREECLGLLEELDGDYLDAIFFHNLIELEEHHANIERPQYFHCDGITNAAKKVGDSQAFYNLGFLSAKGWGMDQDVNEAWKWFEKAKALGDPLAEEIIDTYSDPNNLDLENLPYYCTTDTPNSRAIPHRFTYFLNSKKDTKVELTEVNNDSSFSISNGMLAVTVGLVAATIFGIGYYTGARGSFSYK